MPPEKSAGDLTDKQRAFVAEYLVDLNATQAAIRAGYSERTANEQGARLLANVSVAAAIAAAQSERGARTLVTQDRVLRELVCMGLYDPADIATHPMSGPADIGNLPEDVRRAIVGWGWDKHGNFTLKLASKQSALDSIGKHLGMFTDRGVNIDIASLSTEELRRIANGEDPISVLADTRRSAT